MNMWIFFLLWIGETIFRGCFDQKGSIPPPSPCPPCPARVSSHHLIKKKKRQHATSHGNKATTLMWENERGRRKEIVFENGHENPREESTCTISLPASFFFRWYKNVADEFLRPQFRNFSPSSIAEKKASHFVAWAQLQEMQASPSRPTQTNLRGGAFSRERTRGMGLAVIRGDFEGRVQ